MFIGFEPIFNSESKILVLGSFPSVKSRELNFYYGNKQNRFWNMLEYVYNEKIGESINAKKEFLLNHKIALWDIVGKCEIKGSADSSLICLEVVDLQRILAIANIKKIICNGVKAHELLCKNYQELAHMSVCLPSTSPANARFDKDKWRDALVDN